MDDPIFKLEKVVQTRGDEPLEDFEGPLDLILYLLGKNKIEIQDIPIALILEQYQDYLEKRKRMDLEVASEFITMAAQLMFIKTRMLLNLEDEEAQSEMDALIKSLEERKRGEAYARVRMLSERLAPLSEFGRNILTRPPEPMERGKIYEYDQEPVDLVLTMQEVTDRQGAPEAPPIRAFDEIGSRILWRQRRRRSCGGCGVWALRAFCCCSAAARHAVSWWPRSWRSWSCAGTI